MNKRQKKKQFKKKYGFNPKKKTENKILTLQEKFAETVYWALDALKREFIKIL